MSDIVEWKDVSSRCNKNGTFELKFGRFRLVIVWDSIFCPNSWSTSMYGVFEHHDLKLKNKVDVEIAKNYAIGLAEKFLSDALKDLQNSKG